MGAEEKIAKTNEEILKEVRQKSSQKLSLVAEIFGSEADKTSQADSHGSDHETFKQRTRNSSKRLEQSSPSKKSEKDSPKKKSLLTDIFGSDDEGKEKTEVAEEEYSDVSDGPVEEVREVEDKVDLTEDNDDAEEK